MNFLLWAAFIPSDTRAQFIEHVIDSTQLTEPRGLATGDLDGDGDYDVVVITRQPLTAAQLVWYANDGTGQFGPLQVIDQRTNPGEQVEADDLDGDGDIDLVATWSWGQRVRPYYNDGTGLFSVGPEIAYVGNLYAWSFLLSDVTGDGSPDGVISGDQNQLVLVANDGTGGFLPPQAIAGGVNVAVSLRSIDIDLDGLQDLLYSGTQPGDVVWQRGLGGGSFDNATFIANTNNSSTNVVQAGDLNGDVFPDVIFKAYGAGFPTNALVWAENDTTEFDDFHIIANNAGNGPTRPHPADLDGDGDLDVILSRMIDETIEWYANDGTGSFSPAQAITTTCDSVWWITTADMDGDGAPDVVASAMRSGIVSWFGTGGLNTGIRPTTMATSLVTWPNPFTDRLVIRSDHPLDSRAMIELRDPGGRLLRTLRGNGTTESTIERGALASGPYVIRVSVDGTVRLSALTVAE